MSRVWVGLLISKPPSTYFFAYRGHDPYCTADYDATDDVKI